MIQRIQTVFLAVAALLLALTMAFGIPLLTVTGPNGAYRLLPDAVYLNGEKVLMTYAVLASVTVGLLLAFYAIMQYRNRKFQMNLVKVSVLSQLIFLVMVFFQYDRVHDLATGGAAADVAVSFSPVLSAPVVAIFLCMLAIRAIKKDEALVRSADRLR
jgi:hypothetical protein